MKKILIAAAIMLLSVGAMSAQNSFRGIVKYTITSTGKVDMSIPAEQASAEVKVYDNQLLMGQTIQNELKVSVAADFSMYLAYLHANDIELESYQGDGKFLIRDEADKKQLDSLYLPDTEPGHYYYENTTETKDMFGFKATKMIMHSYDEEGNDNPVDCWFTTEIGPEYCVVLGNLKGFPLVITQQLGEGRAITYTAVEVVKGKVSRAEMLLPDGYKDASDAEFQQFQQELKDAFELMGD